MLKLCKPLTIVADNRHRYQRFRVIKAQVHSFVTFGDFELESQITTHVLSEKIEKYFDDAVNRLKDCIDFLDD